MTSVVGFRQHPATQHRHISRVFLPDIENLVLVLLRCHRESRPVVIVGGGALNRGRNIIGHHVFCHFPGAGYRWRRWRVVGLRCGTGRKGLRQCSLDDQHVRAFRQSVYPSASPLESTVAAARVQIIAPQIVAVVHGHQARVHSTLLPTSPRKPIWRRDSPRSARQSGHSVSAATRSTPYRLPGREVTEIRQQAQSQPTIS
jgi:hypothetical protein